MTTTADWRDQLEALLAGPYAGCPPTCKEELTMTRKQVMARIAEVQEAAATELYPVYVRQEAKRPKRFIIAAPWDFAGGWPDWCSVVKKAFPKALFVGHRIYAGSYESAGIAAVLCFY